jgi:hypothetical protein
MTRSNEAMAKNRRNPEGYGHSAPDTSSLLLDVYPYTIVVAPCPGAEWTHIAA